MEAQTQIIQSSLQSKQFKILIKIIRSMHLYSSPDFLFAVVRMIFLYKKKSQSKFAVGNIQII